MGRHRFPAFLRGRMGALLLAVGLALLALPVSVQAAGTLAGQTIIVDPGHGGMDGGAGAYGRLEKRITLPITLDLGAVLLGQGARVVYTRTTDTYVSLAARTAIANRSGAAAFVSIHVNALNDPSYRGLMTFYGSPSGYVSGVRRSPALVTASRALATDVEAATLAQSGEASDGVHPASYYVLGNVTMPAILVETGFITNPRDGAQLATPAMQQRVADGIAAGVGRFFTGVAAGGVSASPARPSNGREPRGRYTVQPGDTLSALALHFDVAAAALTAVNSLPADGRILAGQVLVIPGNVSADWQPVRGAATAKAAAPTDTLTATEYTVKRGDTLTAIAARFGVSVAKLVQANGLHNVDTLLAGRHLTIPSNTAETAPTSPAHTGDQGAAQRYQVRAGDTLSGIAVRFGVTELAVARANGLSNLDRLYAGRYLTIPGA